MKKLRIIVGDLIQSGEVSGDTKELDSGNVIVNVPTTSLYSFKSEYESKNGKTAKNGSLYRTISIPEVNPYEKILSKDVVSLIDEKQTFYLYVGDSLCPWCRSVIEKATEIAQSNGINKIYYLKVWDDEGEELFRDKYKFQSGDVVKVTDAKPQYLQLLDKFDNVLPDFEIKGENEEKINLNEKRIYAPTFIYVLSGDAIRAEDGISELQSDSNVELTEEILLEQERIFKEFFKQEI